MEVTCPACDQAAQAGRAGGLYRMECLACCARLVLSSWPSRERAAGMLAAIERCGTVSREDVLAEVQRQLQARSVRPRPAQPCPPDPGPQGGQ